MGIISLKEVSKRFGKFTALDKINLEINKGEIIGIVGPSGSGKSVLVKMFFGFFKPSSGKILLDSKLKIGFSSQNNSLYDYLTVRQNANYFSKIYNVSKKNRKKYISRLIEVLNLEDFKRVLVKNLSGGTKKRVDILCSLLNDPDLIILDEPFAGLDPSLIKALSQFILELNKTGKTIIISSHRTNEILKIASRMLLVKNKTLKEITKSELEEAYI